MAKDGKNKGNKSGKSPKLPKGVEGHSMTGRKKGLLGGLIKKFGDDIWAGDRGGRYDGR